MVFILPLGLWCLFTFLFSFRWWNESGVLWRHRWDSTVFLCRHLSLQWIHRIQTLRKSKRQMTITTETVWPVQSKDSKFVTFIKSNNEVDFAEHLEDKPLWLWPRNKFCLLIWKYCHIVPMRNKFQSSILDNENLNVSCSHHQQICSQYFGGQFLQFSPLPAFCNWTEQCRVLKGAR